MLVVHKARVGVVLDVGTVHVVLNVEQWRPGTVNKLQHSHHEDVHLHDDDDTMITMMMKLSTFFGGLCLLYSSAHSLASI